MLHLAGNDAFCPAEAQSTIKAALATNPNVVLHAYPGVDHAFARRGGDHYDRAAAELADQRTTELFERALS